MLALILAAQAALAGGATQISGVAFLDESDTCDSESVGADFALLMTGDLEGCLYTFVETSECSPSGTCRETGTELFVASEGASGQLFFKDDVELGNFPYGGHLRY